MAFASLLTHYKTRQHAFQLADEEVIRWAHDILLSAGQLDVPPISPTLARKLHLQAHPLLRIEQSLDALKLD